MAMQSYWLFPGNILQIVPTGQPILLKACQLIKMINMKNQALYLVFLLATLLSACEKGDKQPYIFFKTDAGYTVADKIVAKNSVVLIGIEAEKTTDKIVLTNLGVTRAYDGGTPETFINETLAGDQGEHYSRDINISTRNLYGTEKYVFTVTDRNGQTNSVSLTLTVQ